MKTSGFLFICLISFHLADGQDWLLLKTMDLKDEITSYSTDNEFRVYTGNAHGDLTRYNPAGLEEEHYSDIANSSLTLIEAWNRLKVFLFFRDQQKISILDRFGTTPVDYELRDFDLGYAWLVAPGVDNSIWTLSTDYNELRKYEVQSKQLILSTPLHLDVSKASHMRAYQNLLIISDREKGLYFFDQFGTLLYEYPGEGIAYFQVADDMLYFLQAGHLVKLDPFNLKNEEKIKAPEGAFEVVIASENRYFFIKKSKAFIYTLAL